MGHFTDNYFGKSKSALRPRSIWGYENLGTSMAPGACGCDYQTDTPATSDYLPPCCVETYLFYKREFTPNGYVIRSKNPLFGGAVQPLP